MKKAFSLIELLVSLIIISVITAAFVPIMIKKLRKSDVALGQTGVVSYNSKSFTEDSEWEVPTRVRKIKVTSVAGGGSGGGASFGSKEITSTQTWVVPSGVTKLKVYMTGAGGGGANGIQGTPAQAGGTGVKYGSAPALTNAVGTIKTAGTYNFTAITPPSNYTAPALASDCSGSWKIGSVNVAPYAAIPSYPANAYITISKVTACGAGGSASRGGRGGYLVNQEVSLTDITTNIKLVIARAGSNGGAGSTNNQTRFYGGAGGVGAHSGANGADCTTNCLNVNCYCEAGGGGGGSTGILNSANSILFEAPGGGGGGGRAGSNTSDCSAAAGGRGGNGGGTNAGLGGYGAYCSGDHICSAGNGGTGYIAGSNGSPINSMAIAGGGYGGSGKGASSSTIFGSGNCNAGKPGAIQVTYSVASAANVLSCQYNKPAIPAVAGKGGGGGGAGQVFVGEIPVTQGQTVTFTIGTGGNASSAGGNTTIAVNGVVKATALGGNAASGVTGGAARGLSSTNNWLGISSSCGAKGSNGSGETGGLGGGTYLKNNTFASGGSNKYGTGGNGGNATITSFATGSKGADGYIYVEWGETNGGGGSSGQVVQVDRLGVTPGQKVNIKIGSGGVCPDEVLSGGIYTGQNGNNGSDSYITIAGVVYARAKGGLGGEAGNFSTHGKGGNQDNSIADCAKGKDGKNASGGEGGSITQAMCSLFDSYRGLGGCGGRMTTGMCFGPASSAEGKAAFFGGGGGGGGGGVKDGVAYKGGEGSVGTVVIEWN